MLDAGGHDNMSLAEEPIQRRPLRYDLPSVMAEQERQSRRLILLVIRSVFIVLLVTVTILTIASEKEAINDFGSGSMWGLILAATAVGVIVLVVDAMTPNKRLSTVVGAYIGICFGLIGAVAIGALIDIVADAWEIRASTETSRIPLYLGLAKVVIGIVLCYLSVSVVLTTKDDFRLVIPYVEFSKQVRGVRPLLADTSALIDGRINDLGHTGFFDAPIIVPRFVIDELQALADSSDKLKRSRGRRGLDMVSKIQANPFLDVTIDDPIVEGLSVDKMLIELARSQKLRILTTDFNLKKVAQIHGVAVLNINDLANTLKTSVVPGETLEVALVKVGENPSQGVGYLPDGTMVVVEDAAELVGDSVTFVVTNSLQTSAGRMIFGKLDAPESGTAASMARAATHQPRVVERPAGERSTPRADGAHGRNPRR